MKAFITGGAGFIGSSMADRLLLGPSNSVTVFDNFTSGQIEYLPQIPGDGRLSIVLGDLLDREKLANSLKGHDIVYHFASNPYIDRGFEDTSLDLQQTILATYNVLEAMRLSAVPKLVFASGSGVYGDTDGQPTPEDFSPLRPISMYGASKLSAEAMISAFSHMFGITSYIFRLANVVGKRQTHGVIFDFIASLKASPHGLTIRGDGKQNKAYIHIDDVLDAIFFVLAMSHERVNVFNVATDDTVDVSWIAQQVVAALGLADVPFQYTGGSRGWPGDVPVVRLEAGKIHKLGWQARLNSQEAITLSVRQLVERLNEPSAVGEPR